MPYKDKEKRYEAIRKHYAKYPEKLAKRKVLSAKLGREYTKRNQVLRASFKARPCADCNIQYPFYVMQFDHVKGQKAFTISQRSQASKKILIEEIAKCEVVCANCHAIRTYTRKLGMSAAR